MHFVSEQPVESFPYAVCFVMSECDIQCKFQDKMMTLLSYCFVTFCNK